MIEKKPKDHGLRYYYSVVYAVHLIKEIETI